MALISGRGEWISRSVHVTTWPDALQSGTFSAQSVANLPDKTVTVTGTFGTGGTVTILGSNDDTSTGTFIGLTDPQGNTISFTADGVETIMENTRWIKPQITSGTSSTSVTVKIVERR